MKVRCHIYVRTAVEGGFSYAPRLVPGWASDNLLHTEYPPQVGDLLNVPIAGRVVTRSWMHPQYGSTHWPYGEQEPLVGPTLVLICEAEDGPFVGEVVADEGDG